MSPKEVAVSHCREHQRGQDEIIQGDHKVDQTAKAAILSGKKFIGALNLSLSDPTLTLSYTSEEKDWTT